jgi:hypothetical protein
MTISIPLSHVERIVLRELLAHPTGVSAVDFWKEHQISPGTLIGGLQRLIENQLVTFEGIFAKMTLKGLEAIMSNPAALFATSEGDWKRIPERYLAPQLPIGEPTIPIMVMVDPEILKEPSLDDSSQIKRGGE